MKTPTVNISPTIAPCTPIFITSPASSVGKGTPENSEVIAMGALPNDANTDGAISTDDTKGIPLTSAAHCGDGAACPSPRPTCITCQASP